MRIKKIIRTSLGKKKTEKIQRDKEFEKFGIVLKSKINKIFGRSLAIRMVDTGSDGTPEIELVNLTTSYYDIERFGVSFVASPRHADILVVSGPVTYNMVAALKKTYDATPNPKFVIALGDDACGRGIFNDSYAVVGSVDKVLPVDVKILGNPPTPKEIILALVELMEKIRDQK